VPHTERRYPLARRSRYTAATSRRLCRIPARMPGAAFCSGFADLYRIVAVGRRTSRCAIALGDAQRTESAAVAQPDRICQRDRCVGGDHLYAPTDDFPCERFCTRRQTVTVRHVGNAVDRLSAAGADVVLYVAQPR